MFLFLSAGGQNDSLLKVIMNYPESKSDLISKARRLILDKFMENDMVSVISVKHYVENELEDEDYVGLKPVEKIFIDFWAADYPPILGYAAMLDSILQARTLSIKQEPFQARPPDNRFKIYPLADLMEYKLQEKTRAKYDSIDNLISAAFLSEEYKSFLRLLLMDICSDTYAMEIDRENINMQANSFLESYPDSRYARFVGTHIRNEYQEGKWGLAIGAGGGYMIPTEELAARYSNSGLFYMDVDLEYARLEALLRLNFGFNRTKTDMTYSGGQWPKGKRTDFFTTDLALGYRIYDGNLFKIIPFVGISPITFDVTRADRDEDEALKELKISSFSYNFGLCVDFKLPRARKLRSSKVETGYTGFRLRYSYAAAQFARKYEGLSGNIHSLTLGMTCFWRGVKKCV
jgi:hypothetical protein